MIVDAHNFDCVIVLCSAISQSNTHTFTALSFYKVVAVVEVVAVGEIVVADVCDLDRLDLEIGGGNCSFFWESATQIMMDVVWACFLCNTGSRSVEGTYIQVGHKWHMWW